MSQMPTSWKASCSCTPQGPSSCPLAAMGTLGPPVSPSLQAPCSLESWPPPLPSVSGLRTEPAVCAGLAQLPHASQSKHQLKAPGTARPPAGSSWLDPAVGAGPGPPCVFLTSASTQFRLQCTPNAHRQPGKQLAQSSWLGTLALPPALGQRRLGIGQGLYTAALVKV